jgi:hypothetical protein
MSGYQTLTSEDEKKNQSEAELMIVQVINAVNEINSYGYSVNIVSPEMVVKTNDGVYKLFNLINLAPYGHKISLFDVFQIPVITELQD